MAPDNERLEIITYAQGAEFEQCQRLCESIDRFIPVRIRHTLVVPTRDYKRFLPFGNRRRGILTTSEALPGRFKRLRVTDRIWIDGKGTPVSGWMIQQLLKLSANRFTDAELLMFVSPDIQFLPTFDVGDIFRQGRLRLHRGADALSYGRHRCWHTRAWALLGQHLDCFSSDYGDQLVSWRRSHLVALQKHVENFQGCPWHVAMRRDLDVSAPILYGAFVENVLGETGHGHFYDSRDLCLSCRFDYQAHDLIEGRSAMPAEAVAIQLEPGLSLDLAAEHAVFRAAIDHTTSLQASVRS